MRVLLIGFSRRFPCRSRPVPSGVEIVGDELDQHLLNYQRFPTAFCSISESSVSTDLMRALLQSLGGIQPRERFGSEFGPFLIVNNAVASCFPIGASANRLAIAVRGLFDERSVTRGMPSPATDKRVELARPHIRPALTGERNAGLAVKDSE